MHMKRSFHKILGPSCIATSILSACTKNQNVVLSGGTAPVLTASATDSIALPITDSTANAVTFYWTNPEYSYSTGTNTLSVNYYLEFDTVGANFTSPNMQTVAFSANLTSTMTVSFLNNLIANGQQLQTGMTHQEQIRVVSFLPPLNSGVPLGSALTSNTLNFAVTPWSPPPTVAPPATGTLYIVGAAVAADNWANPMPAGSIASETFTELSPTHFTITLTLVGGAEYKLISVNGSWTDQWSVAVTDSEPNGGPFVFNGNNCIAPPTSGVYTIDVNFQTGIFTVTAG